MSVKVSIIMGVYNCDKTLVEAIDSILAQTFKDWELIMVDDGSTDDTYTVARQYAGKYSNIFIYQNEKNMGLNFTLNHCLKYTKGQYIARMDGDDISLPTRLEREVNFLDSHPEYAFVSCLMSTFDEQGIWGLIKTDEYPKREKFITGSQFSHAPCVIRTSVMREVGAYSIDSRLLRVEDYHLWFKIYMAGYKGYNIQEALYLMRDDRNARTRRNFKNRQNEAYVKWLIFKGFHLPLYYSVYILRPIILSLIPSRIYDYLHHRKYGGDK